ncbi:hypothetical protein H2202_010006 [Exophiala xenobiotica]|nr:hypothetical protein H2202_010006 [Exophiala xenobiotica]KAK5203235.1 hypothetical protein LTR41_011037 [Exophiala xenobiotica]KAK5225200.1 hypothetical protein LTR47_009625 [Exophiala xenobiotica]KAK5247131.1 hypothetical protein LTS06_007668 [Exophiala xenobiotica]KAK5315556.1 hypothetical protein LTR93_009811 [Exophiala xenobiotica]
MRHTTFIVSFIASLALARPQVDSSELSGLPACARDAAAAALGSAGCALNDTACICKSQAFQDAITTTILQSCSASDVQAAVIFGQSICGSSLATAAPTDSVATVATAAPTGSAVAGGASTLTVPATVTSMASIPMDSASMAMTTSISTVPTTMTTMWNTSCTTTSMMSTMSTMAGPAASVYTGAAVNAKAGQGIVAAFMGVAGAVALL